MVAFYGKTWRDWITGITYNHLNLPLVINFTSNGFSRIEFIYDATGVKLRKTIFVNNVETERRDYINGIEYKGNVLDRIAHTEGAVVRQGTTTTYAHEYTIKDHLGNARVTYSDANNDGTIVASDIKQVNHYYPFGLNMEGNFNGAAGTNKYQYNGKEWNDDFGLGLNDYGARMYDPAIGRWTAVDPMAEGATRLTPYRYGLNNPIRYADWSGFFEIPAELLAKFPNIEKALDKVAARLRSNKNLSDLVVKLGQFRDSDQLLNLFKKDNSNIKLKSDNLLSATGKSTYASTQTTKGAATDGLIKRQQIKIDEGLLTLIENIASLSSDGQQFAEKLFEATFLHEIIHAGDEQDGVSASMQSANLEIEGGKLKVTPREIGLYFERLQYGGPVEYNSNFEVNNFINLWLTTHPRSKDADSEKDKPKTPPRA